METPPEKSYEQIGKEAELGYIIEHTEQQIDKIKISKEIAVAAFEKLKETWGENPDEILSLEGGKQVTIAEALGKAHSYIIELDKRYGEAARTLESTKALRLELLSSRGDKKEN